jgi:hypothetical protein
MDNSFVIVQPEQSQFRAYGPVIRVQNASNTQTFCDLDEHRAIFNIDYLPLRSLADVQRKPENIRVGLTDMDEAGGNKKIHESVQLELSNSVRIQFPCFVANHDNLQSIPCFELADELDHFGIWFRLGEHKASKLSRSKRSFLVEDDPT